ncbi:MAG TPA: hypothetical protein VHD83_09995 [Puia sp.]|nr:hypothetical protein [Puia sp.]
MESSKVIIGATLSEIQKKTDKVKLVFENKRSKKAFTLTFDGFLLETAGPALNRKVKDILYSNVLGFRTLSQVRSLHKSPNKYRQILIQMEGSTEDHKLELLGAFKALKLSSRTPRLSTGSNA